MNTKKTIPSNIRCQSFLIGILYLVGTLSLYHDVTKCGRPYVYSTITVLQLLIIKSWMKIPSNNTPHYYLSIKEQNNKLLQICKLEKIPDRRTFDRRFKVLPLKELIANMGRLFLSEGMVDCISASADSTLLKAAGPIWHKSDIKQKRLPNAGIDTDARWGSQNQRVGWGI